MSFAHLLSKTGLFKSICFQVKNAKAPLVTRFGILLYL